MNLNPDIKTLRDTLTLDFKSFRTTQASILTTPDVQKLAITTPELDRLAMNIARPIKTPVGLPRILRNDEFEEDKTTVELLQSQSMKPIKQSKNQPNEIMMNDSDDSKFNIDDLNINQDKLEPIDMANQEEIKLARKRFRNRIAASKCRLRKLERISRLENRVSSLKSKNNNLETWTKIVDEVISKLYKHINKHSELGCNIEFIFD